MSLRSIISISIFSKRAASVLRPIDDFVPFDEPQALFAAQVGDGG